MIIIAIVVPVAISVLLFVAVVSFLKKRAKKTYDTAAATDGKDSKIYVCAGQSFVDLNC